jgi:hypothetical protein
VVFGLSKLVCDVMFNKDIDKFLVFFLAMSPESFRVSMENDITYLIAHIAKFEGYASRHFVEACSSKYLDE